MSIITQYFETPVGELILASFHNRLCLCDWRYRQMRTTIDKRIQDGLGAKYIEGDSETIEIAKKQLSEYFRNERTSFDIPLLFVGTSFQEGVWNALKEIKYGTTKTYAQLSEQLNNPLAIRAVAAANGANALSIFVPCHRIIGTDGKLVGYAGGLAAKKKLLMLEGYLNSQQTELFADYE